MDGYWWPGVLKKITNALNNDSCGGLYVATGLRQFISSLFFKKNHLNGVSDFISLKPLLKFTRKIKLF